ncbi:MAG TPA: COX15/CtaA family protein [Allosphingosinicella sp.]|nr:COX15/CtaA family protein [Allosphingosinicella sp.]
MRLMATLAAAPLPCPRPKSLSNWLFAVAALVLLMIVVGGITRLTESGLSITRWEPVSGAVPPLSESAWQAEFDLYRDSPQYRKVNAGMTLAEFKFIYFWEYVHRLLGRLIGLAFALPLLWFAIKRAIPPGYGWKLVALLALGGTQGAIGWWMVASGLVDRPEVSHIRLAVHLLTAFLIFGSLVWVAMDLRRLAADQLSRPARMPTLAIWTLSLLSLQFLFGAYVAGLEAGYAYSSWPKMGDEWFPSGTPMLEPFLRNLVDNPIMVQFIHRWLAFIFAAAALLLARAAWLRGHKHAAAAILLTVAVQILLGILTLLTGVEIIVATAHQGMAALVLGAVLLAAHRLGMRTA